MANDLSRGKSFSVPDGHYEMMQGRCLFSPLISTCSPSRNKESDVSSSFNPYEPRPRRRTNVDRYEPNKEPSAAGQSSPRTKRYQKRMTMMKRNSSRVDKKFHAKSIKSGRLTLTSNANLGIFKKGKSSEPINCPKASYLKFSETKFLSKEAQCPAVSEERTQRSHGFKKSSQDSSSECYSDKFIEQELFQSLSNCQQLSVPYDEYVPVVSNVQILSVDDLKDLYNRRNYRESTQKSNTVCGNFSGSPAYQLASTHEPDIPTNTPTKDKEVLLDLLLDTVQDFDEDVDMEFLAELVEATEPSSEHYKPQPADLRAGSVEGPGNPAAEISRLSLSNFGPNNISSGSMTTTGDIKNKTSANLGVTQIRYDDDPSINAPDTWHSRDMAREIITSDFYAGIPSNLDMHQFRRSTNQPAMPAPFPPARQHAAEPTLHRRFWRCNKLY